MTVQMECTSIFPRLREIINKMVVQKDLFVMQIQNIITFTLIVSFFKGLSLTLSIIPITRSLIEKVVKVMLFLLGNHSL